MHPIVNIAVSAAREAGRLIMRHFENLEHIEVESKSRHDFVSQVDRDAQHRIIQVIKKAYPDHAILAEEQDIHELDPNALTWIIDPLDGTTNYLRGIPQFAVSIAFMEKGLITHGVIFDPLKDELFSASRGQGAQFNRQRLKFKKAKPIEQCLIGTGIPFGGNTTYLDAYLGMLKDICPQVSGIRRMGAASLDLAYVAAGRLDGFWEIGLKPWDMAAGILMIEEAGGYVTDFHGKADFLESGNVICGSPKIHPILLEIIKKHIA